MQLRASALQAQHRHDDERREQHAGHEADASQSRYGILVHLACARHVVESLLHAEPDDVGSAQEAAGQVEQE